ncbi:hypothetical protein N9O24_00740 [bacterium]|nr:hypothetical protein [bacterium]
MNTGARGGLDHGDAGIDWRRELVRGYGHHRARAAWKLWGGHVAVW